jgi:MFS family permease
LSPGTDPPAPHPCHYRDSIDSLPEFSISSSPDNPSPVPDTGPPSSVLRERNFRLYYAGIWFSTTAFWVLKIAIGWAAWELSHSAFWTGIVAACYLLPAFVLSPFFGVLADRMRLKRGVQRVVAAQMLIALVISAGFFANVLNVQWLAVLSALYGLISAAYHPMRLTVVGRLVDRRQIPAAAGFASIAFNTARVLGPALAGVLLARFGTATTLLVGSILYAPYLLLFSLVNLRTREPVTSPWVRELVNGWRYAWQLPVMVPVIIMSTLNGVVGRALFELLPAISGEVLNAGANGLAVLTGAGGGGAVLAGVAVARFDLSVDRRMVALVASVALCAVATLATGLSQTLLIAALCCAVAGFSASYAGISSQSILQVTLDDAYRGRVMSLWTTVSFGAPAAGALLMGALAEALGTGSAVASVAALGLMVTLLLSPRYCQVHTRPSA